MKAASISFAVTACLAVVCTTGARAADCNGNGADDAQDIARGTSADCNQNGNPDECDLREVNFGFAPGPLHLEGFVSAVRAADLDGDGDDDLAASLANSQEVAVLLSDGRGTLTAGDRVLAGDVRDFLVAADLNGDGLPDLAAGGRAGARVILNGGGGSLEPPGPLLSTREAAGLAAGDLDGDGDEDLAVLHRSSDDPVEGEVEVLWNRGDAGFPETQALRVGRWPGALLLADLDGDGERDLASGNGLAHSISLLWNVGPRRFERVDLEVRRSQFSPESPQGLEQGDLDGDGDPDLAVIVVGGAVLLYRQESPRRFTGGGRFESGLGYGREFPRTLADLDGDGDLDLVFTGNTGRPGWLAGLLNDGSGSFVQASLMGAPAVTIVAADLDGDRDLDLATGTSGVQLQWNRPVALASDCDGNGVPDECDPDCNRNGTPDHCDIASGRDADCDADSIPDSCQPDCNRNRRNDSCDIALGLSADCDGDGAPDECQSAFDCDGSGVPDACDLREGRQADCNGDGIPDACDLEPRFGLSAREVFLPDAPFSLRPADLDGDGWEDLLALAGNPRAGTGSVSVLLNDRRGDLALSWTYALPAAAAVPADLDGDGDVDVAVAEIGAGFPLAQGLVSILFNHGNGWFTHGRSHPAGRDAHSIAALDLEGDGAMDLAVGTAAGTWLLRNQGGGRFAPAEMVAPGGGRVIAADLDGDGRRDIATDHGALLLNRGGVLVRGPDHPARVGGVAAADLDGDGDLDLFSARGLVGLNRGDGTFVEGGLLPSAGFYEGGGEGLAAGDLDGDLDVDLLIIQGSLATLLRNAGSGSGEFEIAGTLPAGYGHVAVGLMHLDGDGDLDPLVASTFSRSVSLLLNRQAGEFEARRVIARPRAGSAAVPGAVTDLDGDGDLDLAAGWWREDGPGGLLTAENRGGGRFAQAEVALDWTPVFVAAGDMDGDGRAEVIAGDGTTGELRVFLDGPDRPPARVPAGPPPQRALAADLDGDGDLDLLAATGLMERTPSVSVILNRGGGSFAPPAVLSLPQFLGVILVVDADGDADLDIVAGHGDGRRGTLSLLENRGGVDFGEPFAFQQVGAPETGVAADLDGDGLTDLAVTVAEEADCLPGWGCRYVGKLLVLLGLGGGAFAPPEVYHLPFVSSAIAAADTDGNGLPDIALTHNWRVEYDYMEHGTDCEVLLNRGGARFEPAGRFSAATYVILAADLDGEGFPDLVVFTERIEALFNRSAPRKRDRDRDGVPDECQGEGFRRGDVRVDGRVDLADALSILSYLFLGALAPSCREAADADGVGVVDLSDAVYLLRFLFLGGPAPPAPGPPPGPCGQDPDPPGSPGDLGCRLYEGC